MKNSNNDGFDQHYNVQVAADQDSLLIVAQALLNHPNDKQEAVPTLQALAPELGLVEAVAMDNGYFSESNIRACKNLEIDPYIATGREPHHLDWHTFFLQPEPPTEEASPIVKMAYKLLTEIGQAIYRLRKCTVEPIISIIKEILGFRQFSLRGLGRRRRMGTRLSRVQPKAHAHSLPRTRPVLARLQFEKNEEDEEESHSFLPFSQSAIPALSASPRHQFTPRSDKLLGYC